MRKRKYDAELIIKIVKGHIEEGLSSRQLSVQYNIHHGIIEEWIVQYKHNGINAFLQEDQSRVYSMLTQTGMTQSMSRVGKCIDNGPMEGFWGILKRERYYGRRFTDRTSLVAMIEDFIQYYNTERLQRNLGVLTPMEKHEMYFAA